MSQIERMQQRQGEEKKKEEREFNFVERECSNDRFAELNVQTLTDIGGINACFIFDEFVI